MSQERIHEFVETCISDSSCTKSAPISSADCGRYWRQTSRPLGDGKKLDEYQGLFPGHTILANKSAFLTVILFTCLVPRGTWQLSIKSRKSSSKKTGEVAITNFSTNDTKVEGISRPGKEWFPELYRVPRFNMFALGVLFVLCVPGRVGPMIFVLGLLASLNIASVSVALPLFYLGEVCNVPWEVRATGT